MALAPASPGSPDVVLIGEGKSLTYVDAAGVTVKLKISGPGLMSVIRSQNGETEQVRLYGAVPRTTILSGSVHSPNKRIRPTTLIPSIVAKRSHDQARSSHVPARRNLGHGH